MRQIFLIAWREYRQYVFSRGFLLFLIMFPLGFFAAGAAVGFLESNKPTRYFAIYDETGSYKDDIEESLERRRRRATVTAWRGYAEAALEPAAREEGGLPEAFRPDEVEDREIETFFEAGGVEAANRAAEPYRKEGAPAFPAPRNEFILVDLPPEARRANDLAGVEAALRPYLLGERAIDAPVGGEGQLFAAVLIPQGFGEGEDAPAAQYWSRNLTDTALEGAVSSALTAALRREALAGYGLPEDSLDILSAISAEVSSFRPDRVAEEAELSLRDRIETALPAALTYMLVVIIFGVGNLLLTNTIEERSNKIVEVLLSSVTANQLMMGKLLGIAAVGLTMPTVFLIGGLALSANLTSAAGESVFAVATDVLFGSNILAIYIFYFFCAYFIFAMIFLAIGAISNSLQDAQSYMGPVMLLVFAPLPFVLVMFQNPNGLVASILTWIPIYTPYAVMMRAAADPPLWEIVGATALMLVFAFFLMRIMGRIFRRAILQSAPPKIKDVWRLAKKEAA